MGLALLSAVITGLCITVFFSVAADDLWRRDAFDYAQIGREIASGNGWSSKQIIYGLHLRFLADHDLLEEPWPNLHRFPLPSLMMAACFLVLGVGTGAVAAYGILCQGALSAVVFLWAYRAMGGWPAAGIVGLMSLNSVLLETGASGLSEPAVMLFFTGSLYLLWRFQGVGGGWRLFGAGVLFGLSALSRTNVLFVAPVFFFWLFLLIPGGDKGTQGRPRFRRWIFASTAFGLGLFLTLAPWMIRNQLVAGSPFFSLHSYFLLPAGPLVEEGNKSDYSLPWVRDFVSPLDYARENGGLIFQKWKINMSTLLSEFPRFGGTFWLPVVALLGLFIAPGKRLRTFVVLGAVSFFLTTLPVNLTDIYFDKYYYQFLPLLMMSAVGVAWGILTKVFEGRLLGAVFVVILGVMADVPSVFAAGKSVARKSRAVEQKHMEFIEENTAPDAIIFSNQSYAITWKTGRRTIRHHLDRNEAGDVIYAVLPFCDEFFPIDGVYFAGGFMKVKQNRFFLKKTLENPRFREFLPKRRAFKDGAVFYYQ